ncbi:MAG: hypothetical protein K8S25_07105 [Alphaproteobacteria bacterium]|nr:hypothetical protein [Alphaproteobacteria bacterium]
MFPEIPFFPNFWLFVALILAMIAWRIWGNDVVAAFRRMEQRRRDADLQAYFDRMNPQAHFRQTVDQISETTPAIEPFAKAAGAEDPRAIWDGEIYSSKSDAEAARWRHVITKARDFYLDLDRTYGNRVRKQRSSDTLGGDGGETKH